MTQRSVLSPFDDDVTSKSFFVIPFHLQSVLVHSANCVKTCIHWYVEECSVALLCKKPSTPRQLKLKLIYDRQSVGQSVLVSGAHLGPVTKFSFLLEISFRQLRVCYFVAPSLTKGRVCNLLYNCFWALPEQSLLGRSTAELTAIFFCLIWDSPLPGGPGSRIYIPQEQGGPVIPPGTGFPICRFVRLAGQRWRYSNPPPHGVP
jgi:hypothetical protein